MTVDLHPIKVLLANVEGFNDGIIDAARAILRDEKLRTLCEQHEEIVGKRDVDLGFNIFAIVTDLYYRENFHSDILRALLDPTSKHEHGRTFLDLFLDLLKSHGARLDRRHYGTAAVVREEGRIDILIKDDVSKHAIVIENKINGAVDMPRQLPRYVEYAKDQGYEVDAVVYLKLNRRQHPDTSDWTPSELGEVEAKLLCITAYDESKNDLFQGWLQLCADAAAHSETAFVARQYAQLILKLGRNTMNKPLMEDFYTLMIDGNNYRNARSLRGMLDDLILFRVEKIVDTFRKDLAPFTNVANWKDVDAFFTGCHWQKAHLGIDVNVDTEGYEFQFWDRNDREGKNGKARQMLSKMKVLSVYTDAGGQFVKRFAFPAQEAELLAHIRDFKALLGQAIASEAV